jgi:ubiquinone/menaquinone biosynthesis C-methylase UbiE
MYSIYLDKVWFFTYNCSDKFYFFMSEYEKDASLLQNSKEYFADVITKGKVPIVEFWGKLKTEAQNEDSDYLPDITIDDIEALYQQLKNASDSQESFAILAQEAPDKASWYDHVLGSGNRKVAAVLANFIQQRGYSRVVDVGTGSGYLMDELGDSVESIGLDISPLLLTEAREKGHDVAIADATAIPLKTSSVDCVASNGLTRYLSKDQLLKFAQGAERVLKHGKAYCEATIVIEEPGVIRSEQEYKNSFKGLMLLALDRLVSEQNVPEQIEYQDWINAFVEAGFSPAHMSPDTTSSGDRAAVLEFRKPYPELIERVYYLFLRGDAYESETYINTFLYPDGLYALGKGEIPPLETNERVQRLRLYETFSQDQAIHEASMSPYDHFYIRVAPLFRAITDKNFDPEVCEVAVGILRNNLQRYIQQKIDLNSSHWEHEKDREILDDIVLALKNSEACRDIVDEVAKLLL